MSKYILNKEKDFLLASFLKGGEFRLLGALCYLNHKYKGKIFFHSLMQFQGTSGLSRSSIARALAFFCKIGVLILVDKRGAYESRRWVLDTERLDFLLSKIRLAYYKYRDLMKGRVKEYKQHLRLIFMGGGAKDNAKEFDGDDSEKHCNCQGVSGGGGVQKEHTIYKPQRGKIGTEAPKGAPSDVSSHSLNAKEGPKRRARKLNLVVEKAIAPDLVEKFREMGTADSLIAKWFKEHSVDYLRSALAEARRRHDSQRNRHGFFRKLGSYAYYLLSRPIKSKSKSSDTENKANFSENQQSFKSWQPISDEKTTMTTREATDFFAGLKSLL